jgi:hypothetical protein
MSICYDAKSSIRPGRLGSRRFSTLAGVLLSSLWMLLFGTSNLPSFASALIFNNKRVPVVDQWRILGDGKLTGVVKGHPVIPDGDTITTSPLSNPDFATQAGVTVSTLSGSQYKLEEPQASYVAQLRRKQQQQQQQQDRKANSSIGPTTPKRGTKAVTNDLDLRTQMAARNEARRKSKSGLPIVVSFWCK